MTYHGIIVLLNLIPCKLKNSRTKRALFSEKHFQYNVVKSTDKLSIKIYIELLSITINH